jgi:tetratricopeptide (TPR) repeat protein
MNWASAYIGLGQYDKALSDYNDAILDFTEAIRIDPDYADAYFNRGVAHRKLGLDMKAAADFAKAKELGVDP